MSMEMVFESSILQIMVTLLKLLPMDLIKHFCTHYGLATNYCQVPIIATSI